MIIRIRTSHTKFAPTESPYLVHTACGIIWRNKKRNKSVESRYTNYSNTNATKNLNSLFHRKVQEIACAFWHWNAAMLATLNRLGPSTWQIPFRIRFSYSNERRLILLFFFGGRDGEDSKPLDFRTLLKLL